LNQFLVMFIMFSPYILIGTIALIVFLLFLLRGEAATFALARLLKRGVAIRDLGDRKVEFSLAKTDPETGAWNIRGGTLINQHEKIYLSPTGVRVAFYPPNSAEPITLKPQKDVTISPVGLRVLMKKKEAAVQAKLGFFKEGGFSWKWFMMIIVVVVVLMIALAPFMGR